MHPDTIEKVEEYLASIPKFQDRGLKAADFDLERFRKFCQAMGDPQAAFPSVHVGGTNGKGSTCQILASVYRQAGYKTGLYTSPHILDYRERFKINADQMGDEELLSFFSEHMTLVKTFRLTYFELSTAIAFWWFARQKVDIAIIEVGLGGRLDATNIIEPEASVITNVSLDHTDILGDTVQKIAREKAGIIKKGKPIILGNISREAEEVIREVAGRLGSPVHLASGLKPEYDKGDYLLETGGRQYRFESGLIAPVQAWNIAAAWLVAEALGGNFPVGSDAFKEGVAQVRSLYPSLGRFEKLHEERKWYFDGCHNTEAVRAMKTMAETIRPVKESVLVLSIMKDKLNKEIADEFLEFKKIFYHSLDTERSATLEEVQQWIPDLHAFPESIESIIPLFEELKSELVIFTGSFYFYATVRDWLASTTEYR